MYTDLPPFHSIENPIMGWHVSQQTLRKKIRRRHNYYSLIETPKTFGE
jgi:hypothetical protein